jgi:AraC-like DNA-binding protein
VPTEDVIAISTDEGEGGSSTTDAEDHLSPDSASAPGAEVKPKYERSGLQPEVAERIHNDLGRLMLSEKTYRESELTLAGLADLLDVHPNNLSQVINSYENKNFYDYINQLRVEDFKHIVHLPKNRQFTLLSLAFEAGFNSKTAFNRNFKKVTGLSPSAYLKEERIELAET